jgi:hypothetical protein
VIPWDHDLIQEGENMQRNVVWLWPAALAITVLAPLLAPGYVLTYDMVFVPDQAWRADYLGVGPLVPRAVPSDALVSAASWLLPGDILQKLALLAALLGAGLGMLVLTRGMPLLARLAAISWFVWNPYLAERLTIGQWVVLIGYAALPWVAAAALKARSGSVAGCGALVIGLGVGAWSASGGLLAAGMGLTLLLWRGSRASRLQKLMVLTGALMVNAPWIVAGALHRESVTTSAAAVEAFAASAEGHLTTLPTVLSLGGIWNVDTVPDSRLTWVPVVWFVILMSVVAVGVRSLARHWGMQVAAALGVIAFVSAGVAMAGVVDGGLVARLSDDVPGFALLRDGPRYLGGLALVEALAFGFGVARLAGMPRERLVGVIIAGGLVLAPLAVMPDLAFGVGGRLSPVDFPADWAHARSAMVADGRAGRVLVLPDAPYRAYAWNERRPGLDPAPRYFPHPMLSADALTVDGEPVQSDDPTTAEAMDAFAAGDAERLRELGVAYIVVDVEPSEFAARAGALGARTVYASDDVVVYALDAAAPVSVPRGELIVAIAAWLAAMCAWTGALSVAVRRRRRHLSRKPGIS